MVLVLYFLIFISGLFVGSFLNVVSDRVVNGKSIVFGRSICEFCNKTLSALELIPVFSFLLQGGRCKACKEKLPYSYVISEILTGLLFVGVAWELDIFNITSNYVWVVFLYLIIVMSFYVVLTLTDLKFTLLPNKIMIPAIVFVFIFLLLNLAFSSWYSYYQLSNDQFGKFLLQVGYWERQTMRLVWSFLYTIMSSLVLTLFFWLLTKIKDGRAMGGGDVKLALMIGLVNGWPENILAIFLGFFSGAIVSLVLVAFGRKTVKDTVPFGPFMIFGSIITMFFGTYILNWYFGLF